MDIRAKIVEMKYHPSLCSPLALHSIDVLSGALQSSGAFLLELSREDKMAISRWVSPKRTRSYPYARVYDTLGFTGKKVTVIPLIKDEGKDGDRDYLQYDTISLMSLLGVYVVISYYKDADVSGGYNNKITNQRFDVNHISSKLMEIKNSLSDALHWNLNQLETIHDVFRLAIDAYGAISNRLGIEMHSFADAEKRMADIVRSREAFIQLSRNNAQRAQMRESVTVQPQENLDGSKSIITITNLYGGEYYFTADEAFIEDDKLHLIEGKHTKYGKLPSMEDIKDGLLKMVLFSNLAEVRVDGQKYTPVPTLKLTSETPLRLDGNTDQLFQKLKNEASNNGFKVVINNDILD